MPTASSPLPVPAFQDTPTSPASLSAGVGNGLASRLHAVLDAAEPPAPAPLVAWHGTHGQFDTLRRAGHDLGIHFGTEAQARERLAFKELHGGADPATARVDAYALTLRNPLRLPDANAWNSLRRVVDALRESGQFPDDAMDAIRSVSGARALIRAHGFDGVVYRNPAEVPGMAALIRQQQALKQVAWHRLTPAQQAELRALYQEGARLRTLAEDSYLVFEPNQATRLSPTAPTPARRLARQ